MLNFAVTMGQHKINWDAMGIITSVACAIHCALLPVIMSSLPVFGVNIIHNQAFEWTMIGIALVVGCYSLYHGYTRHHRQATPLLIFAAGFIFLVLKQVFHSNEVIFLSIAVACIITAHFFNYRLSQASKCSAPGHSH